MSRSTRLLTLLQVLRGKSRAVTAAVLAAELGVSERTLYRDIAELSAQGAPIYGEAGVGYVLRPGLFLPPLMLSEDEASGHFTLCYLTISESRYLILSEKRLTLSGDLFNAK